MVESNEDFASMLEASLVDQPIGRRYRVGDKVNVMVLAIRNDDVLLDLGGKTEGFISANEFLDDAGECSISVGDSIDAYVVKTGHEIQLSKGVGTGAGAQALLDDAYKSAIPVEGTVKAVNQGGFDVEVAGKRAFCPISQITLYYCEEPAQFVEQTFSFLITEMSKGNIVLSRRKLLEQERAVQAEALWNEIEEGAVLDGQITRIMDFGAFVDIGGVEGLVHVSQMSYERVEDPKLFVTSGEKVRVEVVNIDREKKRIGLSMRALAADPWDEALERLPLGTSHEGTVTRVQHFGAFVDLGKGIEGLIHISELSEGHIAHPKDVVDAGDRVLVRILDIDLERKRIALTMRERKESTQDAGEVTVGALVEVEVSRAESYGLLVRFGANRALLPKEEIGNEGHAASLRTLAQTYPEGTKLRAKVTEVDPDSGRIRVSMKAVAEEEERQTFQRFQDSHNRSGGFGTFGDLLKGQKEKG